MLLNELFNEDKDNYYSPENDSINRREIGDTRKEVLTLKKINKLKKIRAMKKLEDAKREDLLSIMYGASDEGGGGDFGGTNGF